MDGTAGWQHRGAIGYGFGWAKGTSPEMVYRQICEVRRKYPGEGIIKMVIPDKAHGGLRTTPEIWARYAMDEKIGAVVGFKSL